MHDRLPVALTVDAYLLDVLVKRHFESKEEIGIISRLTESQKAVGTEGFNRPANWRKVCFANDPNSVAGWASIEHPDHQEDAVLVQSPAIHALVLYSELSRAPPYALGHFFRKIEVYTVLHVRDASSEGKHERIGVGKLVGDNPTLAFSKAEQRRMVLV